VISLTALTRMSRFKRPSALLRYVQSVERSTGVVLVVKVGDGRAARYVLDEQATKDACPMVFAGVE